MAKYTMLLNDYVRQGYTLPSFEEIEGFQDMFFEHFLDREIGFDTPDLFSVKLAHRASLVMPFYAQLVANQTKYLNLLNTPIKTRYLEEDITSNTGAQHNSVTDLPINATTATPSALTDVGARADNSHREHEEREEGQNNVNDILNVLNTKIKNILEDCLNEFESLFMGVY